MASLIRPWLTPWTLPTGMLGYESKLVGGDWNMTFIFPYIENNHPNWLLFFRGVQTTNQKFSRAGTPQIFELMFGNCPSINDCWVHNFDLYCLYSSTLGTWTSVNVDFPIAMARGFRYHKIWIYGVEFGCVNLTGGRDNRSAIVID